MCIVRERRPAVFLGMKCQTCTVMHFSVLDFGLAHYGSQPFNYVLIFVHFAIHLTAKFNVCIPPMHCSG